MSTIENATTVDHELTEVQTKIVLGHADNFWVWTPEHGFDLSHPVTPDASPLDSNLHLHCALSDVTLDTAKTALVIIDMQNFAMSTALNREEPAYIRAEKNLLTFAIPAARKCGMQVIWLNWGLTEDDLNHMSPAVFRVFGWTCQEISTAAKAEKKLGGQREVRARPGLGDEIGLVTLEDGTLVDGGRMFMRDTWNAALHAPLAAAFREGQQGARPDLWFHKNRNSGLCESNTSLCQYLRANGLRTLLFAGLNTDQCVMGTLQDAHLKGFDTILLRDGCATDSPSFAQDNAEFNCIRAWGFQCTCEELACAVQEKINAG
ncbi:MAG: hypothetical protein M1828_002671 [Chrysothrix sp. TS-e1954]|nr:MAG: hypothetical protein M1828_002671 [Chrysothrix sp. TS-e1954]